MRRKEFRKRSLALFFAACLLINTCSVTVLAEESASAGVPVITAAETPEQDTDKPGAEEDGSDQSGQPSDGDTSDEKDENGDQGEQPSDSDSSDDKEDNGETEQPSENDPSAAGRSQRTPRRIF